MEQSKEDRRKYNKGNGGAKPGAGRPSSGKHQIRLFGTNEEEVLLRKYLEVIRK